MRTKGTMKQIVKRFLLCTLTFAMILTIAPIHAEAKTVALHTVYSQKQISNRIGVIRDYYYNKPKQLRVTNQKIYLNTSTFTVSYYVHDKDLMFGYGVDGKTEYRMYFYNNQLIQLLVDAPGQSRKTYTQLYKKLETIFYDEHVAQYMKLENYARKAMDIYASSKRQILEGESVVITKVSKDTIVYHKVNFYGSDGCMWSIGKKAYKAKLSSNVKIEDYSYDPMEPTYRNVQWLKKRVSSPYLGLAVHLKKDGNKISKITTQYFA